MKSQKNILKSIEGLSDIELFVIDLFCGAGGLSEGVEEARLDGNRCGKVVCCVNHDKNAILSHDANIPDALHFIEDIRTLELSPISTIVERIRQLYPDAMIMLHASLECTNFSKAKGGQPRDADSRTLAEHLFRYIDVIDPDYIQIENVEEFMSWGDMDENGKPISMDKGRLYQKWVRNVLTKDRLSLVSPFFMNQYSGGGQVSDINSPCPAVTTTPKQNLVTYQPWIMNTAFSNVGSSIEEPSQTITANRKWHYLMNPQFNSAGGSVDSPCFTLIARMDKMPPYLVATESGQVAIEIYNNDSPMTVKIKEFMALYGIVDIKMRMLRIPELKKIMGFPEDYVLIGTQADQKKFIGNAVEVTQARKNTEALCKVLRKLRLKKSKEIA